MRLDFEAQGEGRFVAEYETDQLGLYRLANGDLTAWPVSGRPTRANIRTSFPRRRVAGHRSANRGHDQPSGTRPTVQPPYPASCRCGRTVQLPAMAGSACARPMQPSCVVSTACRSSQAFSASAFCSLCWLEHGRAKGARAGLSARTRGPARPNVDPVLAFAQQHPRPINRARQCHSP